MSDPEDVNRSRDLNDAESQSEEDEVAEFQRSLVELPMPLTQALLNTNIAMYLAKKDLTGREQRRLERYIAAKRKLGWF